jgi:hypothetical protein
MKTVFGCPKRFFAFLLGLGFVLAQMSFTSPALAQSALAPHLSLQFLRQYGEAACVQPPTHLNRLSLTDAQLSLYGFPLHQVLNSDPARWSAVLAHAQHRYCGSHPGPMAANGPASSYIPAVTVQKYYGQRWGGNGAYGPRGTYRYVDASFTVPSVSPPCCPQNGSVSFWVGLGGAQKAAGSSWGLIQAGVTISVSSSGTQTSQAFWEYENQNSGSFGNGPNYFNLPVHVNDSIYVYVDSNLGNNGVDTYYVEDWSGNSYNSAESTYTPYFSDSATGECIAERNGFLLAYFGTEGFTGCYIGTNSTGNFVNNWNHYDFIPTSDGTSSGAPLMTINPIDSTGDFSVTWLRSS